MTEPKQTNGDVRIPRWMVGVMITLATVISGQGALTVKTQADVKSLSASVSKLERSVESRMSDRYTSMDASSDRELMLRMLDSMSKRQDAAERRLERLEALDRSRNP